MAVAGLWILPFYPGQGVHEPLGWHFPEGNERELGKAVLVCPVFSQDNGDLLGPHGATSGHLGEHCGGFPYLTCG